jgi:serine protease Do
MVLRCRVSRAPLTALVLFPALLACSPGGTGDSHRDEALAREVGAEAPGAHEADPRATGPAGEPEGGTGFPSQDEREEWRGVPGGSPEVPGQSVEASRATALVRAAERVAPSVVSISVLREQQIRPQTFFDQFFLPPSTSRRSAGYGSGFVFHEGGYILTNDHVVRGALQIRVTLPDGRDLDARLVGSDGLTDVAVLRVEGGPFPMAPLGSSQGLLIGEWSMAIGNPFANLLSNSEPTVTAGVVSAVGRHIIPSSQDQGFYLGMIQTDASINPGNSGGPLVNALGEVIGVNTSIFSRSGGSEGLGFAIPIDRALRVAEDLMQFGEVRRAWTGLGIEAAEADDWGRTHGVRVSSVAPGSPAAAAGLSVGDRLVRANGRPLSTPLDFEAVLLDLRAGDPVALEAERRSRPYNLVTQPLPTARAERVEILQDLEVVTVTPQIRAEQDLRSEAGALITGISPALSQSLGLRRGDVLLQINNTPIRTADDAARAFRELRAGLRVRLYFERGGAAYFREFTTRG